MVAYFSANEFAKDFDSEDPNLARKIMVAANECMHISLTLKRPGKMIICRVFHYVEIDLTVVIYIELWLNHYSDIQVLFAYTTYNTTSCTTVVNE